MIRAAVVGVAVGVTAVLSSFAPMFRNLSHDKAARAWLNNPRTRR